MLVEITDLAHLELRDTWAALVDDQKRQHILRRDRLCDPLNVRSKGWWYVRLVFLRQFHAGIAYRVRIDRVEIEHLG
jgi:hypothetical protein